MFASGLKIRIGIYGAERLTNDKGAEREMEVKTTERGFELIEFKDRNGEPCSLQQSSATDLESDAGAAFVWLGCERNASPHMGHQLSPRMHLHREQVIELVTHLQAWLETGSFEI